MRIYPAGRYSRRDELRIFANDLRNIGHTITSRWLNTNFRDDNPNESSAAPLEERGKYALIDMLDILSASCVINFTEAPGTVGGARGGRHVELGMAIAWQKRIIVVGHRENIFHHLVAIEFYADHQEVLTKLIEEIQEEHRIIFGDPLAPKLMGVINVKNLKTDV